MNTTRWTLGAVLVAAISVWGLTEAGASPFSTWVLSDDLGNQVNGSAPEQSEWGTDGDGSAGDNNGHDNNGHGNNEDGVDSSNAGQGQGGPNGGVDESCDGTGDCVDDEINNGGSDTDTESTTGNGNGNGKGKGKKK